MIIDTNRKEMLNMSYDTAMGIKRIRHLTGLSQEKFGRKYGIPKRTIQNWELDLNEPAPYLIELLEFKVKSDVGDEGIEA